MTLGEGPIVGVGGAAGVGVGDSHRPAITVDLDEDEAPGAAAA